MRLVGVPVTTQVGNDDAHPGLEKTHAQALPAIVRKIERGVDAEFANGRLDGSEFLAQRIDGTEHP